MVLLQRKLYFSKDRGGQTFLGGGGGGGESRVQVLMLISIETHITCDFRGGGGPEPQSLPLDPNMVSSPDNSTSLHV